MKHARVLVVIAVAAGINAAPPPEPTVHRGETVTIVSTSGGIRLSAPGRALKNGRPGDRVPVFNTATGRSLRAVVRDGWVEVPTTEAPRP